MLDDDELRWLDEQMRGDVDHLLVGTSLPFLMAPALHHLEAFERGAGPGRARVGSLGRLGEWLRTRPTSSTGRPSSTASATGRDDRARWPPASGGARRAR